MADKLYVVQTAPKVIQRCMLMTTDPGDLVLDPTCGSGTTAYVAEQWGRRWITIDTSRVAVAIARQRLLTAKFDYLLPLRGRGGRGSPAGLEVPDRPAHHAEVDRPEPEPRPDLRQARADPRGAARRLRTRPLCARDGHHPDAPPGEARREAARRGQAGRHRRRPAAVGAAEGGRALGALAGAVRHRPRLAGGRCGQAVTAYRKAWRAKMDEVNACIAANAEQEELVDQPEVVARRRPGQRAVHRRGSCRPRNCRSGEDGLFGAGAPNEFERRERRAGSEAPRTDGRTSRRTSTRWSRSLQRRRGPLPEQQADAFARLEPLFETRPGARVSTPRGAGRRRASGRDPTGRRPWRVVFGPQYGPVTAQQVEDAIRAGRRYDDLVVAGFTFDAEALGGDRGVGAPEAADPHGPHPPRREPRHGRAAEGDAGQPALHRLRPAARSTSKHDGEASGS